MHAIEATGTGSTVIVSGNGKVQTSGTIVDPAGPELHAIITYGNVEIKDNAQVSAISGEVIVSLPNDGRNTNSKC